jgi:hypothetical protein
MANPQHLEAAGNCVWVRGARAFGWRRDSGLAVAEQSQRQAATAATRCPSHCSAGTTSQPCRGRQPLAAAAPPQVPAARDDALSYGPDWRTLVLQDRGEWDKFNAKLFPRTRKAVEAAQGAAREGGFRGVGRERPPAAREGPPGSGERPGD